MKFRPLGQPGERFPAWARALRGESGVYVLKVGRRVVYVGESHTGRLFETMVRHGQSWRRSTRSQLALRFQPFGAVRENTPNDPGVTYPRESLLVAFELTKARDAIDRQNALIVELRPRDNIVGVPSDADEMAPARVFKRRRGASSPLGLPPLERLPF